MISSLAARLRSETRALHHAAEHRPFMQDLLRARMRRRAYCLMLRNLHPIYTTLESALQAHAAHPLVAPVCDPAYARAQALGRDLEFLDGPHWETRLPRVPASERYTERLEHLRRDSPHTLTAHAYVRFLGDLSGGQLLKGIVRAGLDLATPGNGTDFYDFGDPQHTHILTQAMRAGLQNIPGDGEHADAIVAEAQYAYRLHLDLFDQLESTTTLDVLNAS